MFDEKQATHLSMMRTLAYNAETDEQVSRADSSVTLID